MHHTTHHHHRPGLLRVHDVRRRRGVHHRPLLLLVHLLLWQHLQELPIATVSFTICPNRTNLRYR